MNIESQIQKLEVDLKNLRLDWKNASPALKTQIEGKAQSIKSQLSVLERVLKRRKIKEEHPDTRLFD